MSKAAQLVEIAKQLATSRNGFVESLGPGMGNRRTNAFVSELREKALARFGLDHSEVRFCKDNSSRFDFYFRDEQTIVEIALGLPNPNTEFEKDLLKALVARDHDHPVARLVFVSRQGAIKKCEQPARAAMIAWALKHHQLTVEIVELGGRTRIRVRRSKA